MAKRQRLAPARNLPTTASNPASAPHGPGLSPAAGIFADHADPPADAPRRRAPIANVAGDAADSAALSELAETLHSARAEGRMIQRLPLDVIEEGYLVRDRMVADEEEMQALCDSLRARGQQTAIEVANLGGGRWGLISGWRRLTALRRLHEAGEGPDSVLAIARAPQEASDAYLAMVEENEIRVGLSYYERARIVARAVDKGVFRTDRAALAALFHAASRPKRSKIGSFVRIVRALDPVLQFPATLTERAGLSLAAALDADAGLESRMSAALSAAAPKSAAAEAELIALVVEDTGTRLNRAERTAALDAGEAAKKNAAENATAPDDRAGQSDEAPLKASNTSQRKRAAPETTQIGPELAVTAHDDGRLTLAGTALNDPSFRTRLLTWLNENRP